LLNQSGFSVTHIHPTVQVVPDQFGSKKTIWSVRRTYDLAWASSVIYKDTVLRPVYTEYFPTIIKEHANIRTPKQAPITKHYVKQDFPYGELRINELESVANSLAWFLKVASSTPNRCDIFMEDLKINPKQTVNNALGQQDLNYDSRYLTYEAAKLAPYHEYYVNFNDMVPVWEELLEKKKSFYQISNQ